MRGLREGWKCTKEQGTGRRDMIVASGTIVAEQGKL